MIESEYPYMQASAEDRDNHGYVHHEEWKKGATMRDEDWRRGEHVDITSITSAPHREATNGAQWMATTFWLPPLPV